MSDSSDSSVKTAIPAQDGASGSTPHGPHVTVRRAQRVRVSTEREHDFRKMNLKVPPFSPDDPEIWFALLEGQFENFNITEDSVKFNNVIVNLDMQHAKAVKDIIVCPPAKHRYEKIKTELIRRLSASHEKKVKQLLTHEELGDRKPSQFLRHLQDLAGPSVPEDFIKTIWSNRLPNNIQTVLASQTTQPLDQLSDLADRIHELTSPYNVASTSANTAHTNPLSEIAELRKMVERLALKIDEHTRTSNRSHYNNRSRPQRRQSPSQGSRQTQRTRSNSSYRKYPLCWYHSKHGGDARSCVKPCDFDKKAGNFTGSR